jgi:hypothetical protein
LNATIFFLSGTVKSGAILVTDFCPAFTNHDTQIIAVNASQL